MNLQLHYSCFSNADFSGNSITSTFPRQCQTCGFSMLYFPGQRLFVCLSTPERSELRLLKLEGLIEIRLRVGGNVFDRIDHCGIVSGDELAQPRQTRVDRIVLICKLFRTFLSELTIFGVYFTLKLNELEIFKPGTDSRLHFFQP